MKVIYYVIFAVLLLLAFATAGRGNSLICPPCERLSCSVRKNRALRQMKLECTGGITTDVCNCCPVCAKKLDEKCGGAWNYLGKCGEGLYCRASEASMSVALYNPASIKQEVPFNGIPEGTCTKIPNTQGDKPQPGTDKRPKPEPRCKPKCTPEYCTNNPKEFCSAIDVVDMKRDCHGRCQHTSCRACSWVDPDPDCGGCPTDDFRCINRFAKCIKRQYCSKDKFPCKSAKAISRRGKFQCMVPKCL